ncbi:MAG: hypothetical protein GX158_05450 [Bacteroidales bacterium]|nr:hypothetical protein [Bacteroidales bacterium]
MNTLKIFIAALVIFFSGMEAANAQFMREIRNRAIERSKDVIIDKVTDKAAEKTGHVMDKLLNPDLSQLANPTGKKVDMSNLPDAYHFTYLYRLKMSTTEGDIDFDYYLNPNESYMGTKIDAGIDMTMVFDEGNNVLLTFINDMPIATELDTAEAFDDDMDIYNDYTFSELPDREFLGYNCVGRKMENDDYRFIIYIAPEMEAGFGKLFKSERANMPPAMQATAKEYENGLMMYMEMHDKKNKKSKNTSGTMECLAFEPAELIIHTK